MRRFVNLMIALSIFFSILGVVQAQQAKQDHLVLSPAVRNELTSLQMKIYQSPNDYLLDASGDNQHDVDYYSVRYALALSMHGNKIAEAWVRKILNYNIKYLDPIWGGVYNLPVINGSDHSDYAKSLSKQGEDLSLYSLAYAYLKDPSYLLVSKNIVDYMVAFLQSPGGAFYSGQFAYSASSEINKKYYQSDDQQRRKIGLPLIDKNIYANENGIVIDGLIQTYLATGEKKYLELAEKSADWIIDNLGVNNGGFKHSVNVANITEINDTLRMISALSNLYKVTLKQRYLDVVKKSLDYIQINFKNISGNGFKPEKNIDISSININNTIIINVMIGYYANLIYLYTDENTYRKMRDDAFSYLYATKIENIDNASVVLWFDHLYTEGIKKHVIDHSDDNLQNIYREITKQPHAEEIVIFKKSDSGEACDDTSCPIPDLNAVKKVSSVSIQDRDSVNARSGLSKQQSDIAKQSKSVQSVVDVILEDRNIFVISIGFLIFGILLGLTPCTFPVLLVLATFLMGQGIDVAKDKILKLSVAYVVAMAFTYAIAGILSALLGVYVQVYFQQKWIIITTSILLTMMAFSMLGLYKIKLPHTIKSQLIRFNTLSASQSYLGAAIMGIVATLIASPCTAAPIVGALTFISQTGDMLLGGAALFCMGLGVGTPLIVISVVGENLLPKMQNWQVGLQAFFGLLLIAVAIWLVSRVISPVYILMLWSALAITTALYMGALRDTSTEGAWVFWRAMSIMLLVYGVALFVGALLGSKNVLDPLAISKKSTSSIEESLVKFEYASSMSDLDKLLSLAVMNKQPIILDFYAEWCAVCKKMDKQIFENANISHELSQFKLIRIDLTTIDASSLEIAKKYDVTGPPAVIFFDKSGHQLKLRLYGDAKIDDFKKIFNDLLR